MLFFSKLPLLLFLFCAFSFQQDNPVQVSFPNQWQIQYAVEGDSIYFLAIGVNPGYVVIGISDSSTNFDISNIDVVSLKFENNQVVIEDRSNIGVSSQMQHVGNGQLDSDLFPLDTQRSPQGTSDYTLDESSDTQYDPSTNAWNVIFHRKLNTQDHYDVVLHNQQSFIIHLALLNDFTWNSQPIFHSSLNLDTSPSQTNSNQKNSTAPSQQQLHSASPPNSSNSQSQQSPSSPQTQSPSPPSLPSPQSSSQPSGNQPTQNMNHIQNTTQVICYQGICFNPLNSTMMPSYLFSACLVFNIFLGFFYILYL